MLSRFSIVTWNIRKGKGIRGSRPEFRDLIESMRGVGPDVVLCQEVFHEHEGGVQQSAELASELELLQHYLPNATYARGHHGNATLARWPLIHVENRDVSPNRVERRGILYTRFEPADGHTLHVFNTHFALAHRHRMRQARALADMVRDHVAPEDCVLLGGDFNDWNGLADGVICRDAVLDNAMLLLTMRERRTFSTRRPLLALDRIYYRNLHLEEIRVLRGAPWDGLSDHFPVFATFSRLPATPEP